MGEIMEQLNSEFDKFINKGSNIDMHDCEDNKMKLKIAQNAIQAHISDVKTANNSNINLYEELDLEQKVNLVTVEILEKLVNPIPTQSEITFLEDILLDAVSKIRKLYR